VRRTYTLGVVLSVLLACAAARWLATAAAVASGLPVATDDSAAPIQPIPIPDAPPADSAKLALGARLFADRRLSQGNVRACASCHALDTNGATALAHDVGADGLPLTFNTPTIFNAALSFRLNWQGKARTLEDHAAAILLSPKVMATSWEEIIPKLRADADLRQLFTNIYGEDPTPASVLDAIAVFERSLVTPDSRFDRYLRGDHAAITPEEERGFYLFSSFGCVACHQGVNVGGNLYQRHGIFPASPGQLEGPGTGPLLLRVPSLRNVAVTPPYFHDGSAPTLEAAIREMARAQLGRVLGDADVAQIAAFLRTLTGEYHGRALTAPTPLP
jgi:cytochrome c peroxidase